MVNSVHHARKHEGQPCTRHEHERRHHSRREKHVNILNEERSARLVVKQKAVGRGEYINLKLMMNSMYLLLIGRPPDPNASRRTRKQGCGVPEFHGSVNFTPII